MKAARSAVFSYRPSRHKSLVTADYSQIELRILAAISGDEVMQRAFADGPSISTPAPPQRCFGVPMEEVTAEMRTNAKAVNFGIVYGISDFGLARNLGIPGEAGCELHRALFRPLFRSKELYGRDQGKGKRSGLCNHTARQGVDTCQSCGPATIMCVRSVNAPRSTRPIQGTAADIIKIAMINVFDRLANDGFDSKLILQVHDELIVDAVPGEIDAVSRLLKECMETAYPLSVPLVATIGVGANWLSAK